MPDYNDPEFWDKEIARGMEKRTHYGQQYEWEKMKEIWDSGAQHVTLWKESTHQDVTPFQRTAFVNWIWAFAQTFIPAVYWKHPKILVRPKSPLYMTGAKFAEPVINAAMKEAQFRVAVRRALNDCLAFGHGWVKLGWFTRFGEVPPARGVQGKGQSTLSQETYLRNDSPYAYRIPVDRMIVDPEAECFEEARWVVQEHFMDYEDVKKDPYLKHKRDIVPSIYKGDSESAVLPLKTGSNWESKENRWVRMFEIWDRDRSRVMLHCYGSSDWNRVVEPWPFKDMCGFPYKLLTVTDSLTDVYPVSVMLPWLPLVEELSYLRSIRLEHISKMVKKLLVEPGAIDDDARKALSDPAIDVVEIAGLDRNAVKDFDGLKPDPNLYASEEQVKQDIREISGFSEILSGQVPFSRIAATTSAIMERNATIRFDHYAERLGDFIIECATDLFKIARDFQNYPTTVQIAGSPSPEWMEITAKQLAGDYFFTLDLDELSVSSKQQRIKESFDVLSSLAQFPEVKRDSLIRDFLLASGRTDIDDYVHPPAGPPADPMFENLMMVRGIPVKPNPSEDFELHLMVHRQFMEQDQRFFEAARLNPAIRSLFVEHIQQTLGMANMTSQMQVGPTGRPQAGPQITQSMQQGQAPVQSQQPAGGNMGQGGGGTQNFQRALNIAQR